MNPSTSFEDVYRVQTAAIERLEAENALLRASMQAVIEEYDDSNPLAIVIEDMRVMLAYDASNATTTGPRATSASDGK